MRMISSKRASSNGKYVTQSIVAVASLTVTIAVVALAKLKSNGCAYAGIVKEDGGAGYGVDISFPIHHSSVSDNFPWLHSNTNSQPVQLLGDRQAFYNQFLRSCRQKDGRSCDETENTRIEMNLKQPASMVVSIIPNLSHNVCCLLLVHFILLK